VFISGSGGLFLKVNHTTQTHVILWFSFAFRLSFFHILRGRRKTQGNIKMQKILFSTFLFTSVSNLYAQEQLTENLPEMVVTATRTEVPKNTLSAATTVFTRDDIEKLQAKSIPELLRGSAGIDVTQSGGYGQISSIFMRGTNSSHVLVLVDGIKVGSVTAGITQFEFIPIDQIERVEIIRGSQSSLYGSEAIGGVIQIFTRKGSETTTPKVTLESGGGSYYTHRTAGSVSGKFNNSWYSASASHFDTDGFDVGGGSKQPDKDGYKNTAVNARVGHHFDNNAELEASFLHNEGTTFYDGFYNKTNFVNQVSSVMGSLDILENWRSTLRLGQSLDQNDSFFSSNNKIASRFDSIRWNASWLNQLTLSENHQFIFGSDYRLDEIESFTKYVESSRYDVGVFGEMHSRFFNDHFVNASVRWDENQAFGDYVTGSVGWRYNWNYGISALANFGNAFRSPNFNELYYPKDEWGGGGNPNLKPEQSKTYEVGLLGEHDWGDWEVRAYHTDIDNLILGWPPKNVAKVQIQGIEAQIGTEIYGFKPKLTMNLLNPEDKATGERLLKRTDKSLSLDISRSIFDFDVGATVIAQGNKPETAFMPDFSQKIVEVGGFVTVDLRSAYHINKNWTLNAKLNNLLDKNYQTVNTYNTADRNFFVSIHYNN
jgi:vitamin B12 transporter